MPVYFWNDADSKAYRAAYFDKFEGIWAHGDFILKNPKTQGGIVMLGRSDGTLNPNGVRFGSAEIYNIVEPFHEIADRYVYNTECLSCKICQNGNFSHLD